MIRRKSQSHRLINYLRPIHFHKIVLCYLHYKHFIWIDTQKGTMKGSVLNAIATRKILYR